MNFKIERTGDESLLGKDTRFDIFLRNIKVTVDDSSRVNRNGLVFFMLVQTYLFLILISTNDPQILFSAEVKLPILNVIIPNFYFFTLCPFILIALHFNFLLNTSQHVDKILFWKNELKVRKYERNVLLPPFLFNYMDEFHTREFTITFIKFTRFIISFILPVLILLTNQYSFSKLHYRSLTTFHFGMLLLDLFLISFYWGSLVGNKPAYYSTNNTYYNFFKTNKLLSALMIICCLISFLNCISVYLVDVKYFSSTFELSKTYSKIFPHFTINEYDFSYNPSSKNILVHQKNGKRLPILEVIDLSGRNLKFANFNRNDFHGVNFKGSRLDGASFVSCSFLAIDMEGTYLNGSNFENAIFENANLKKAEIMGAMWDRTILKGAILSETNFSNSSLKNSNFESATLRKTIFDSSIISDSIFNNSYMVDSNLNLSIINGSTFTGAKMTGVNLNNVEGEFTNFTSANLLNATIHDSNLNQSTFKGAKLDNAEFIKTWLADGDFSQASLFKTKLQGANLNRAKFFGTYLESSEMNGISHEGIEIKKSWGKIDFTLPFEIKPNEINSYKPPRYMDRTFPKTGLAKTFEEFIRIRNSIPCTNNDTVLAIGIVKQYLSKDLLVEYSTPKLKDIKIITFLNGTSTKQMNKATGKQTQKKQFMEVLEAECKTIHENVLSALLNDKPATN